MERRKGTLDLLRAIPLVLQVMPKAQFVFIGSDRPHCPGNRTHRQFLESEFPENVRNHVKLLGRLPDPEVEAWFQRASIFVAPSLYESFGLVFLEAMRWGTPVIGTTAGGIPEVVEHGKSGILVPPENHAELARAIIELLQDKRLRDELGHAGRERCRDKFSIDSMAQEMESLYLQAAEQWRRKAG